MTTKSQPKIEPQRPRPRGGIGWGAVTARGVAVTLAVALAGLLTGCTSVVPAHVAAFATSVTAAKTQTDLAFDMVNNLTSEAIIDYAAAQPKLVDSNLFEVLPPESVAVWDQVFGALEKYSQQLVLLTAAEATKDYQQALENLASQIQTTGQKLQSAQLVPSAPAMSPGFATAVTELGNVVLKVWAQHQVLRAMQAADANVQRILTEMADVVGADPHAGLRGTVSANWENLKVKLKDKFRETSDAPAKRTLVVDYLKLRDNQAAQALALAALRRSLLALATAHHALALGTPLDASLAINAVTEEVRETRDLYNKFKTSAK